MRDGNLEAAKARSWLLTSGSSTPSCSGGSAPLGQRGDGSAGLAQRSS